jgi:hypothetical protein
MYSPYNFSIKKFTEIFHLVYKGSVPFFQCKIILDRSVSMVEVDGLSIIVIDLHIPALTARLHLR